MTNCLVAPSVDAARCCVQPIDVLVIDDDDILCRGIQRMVSRYGYRADIALTLRAGLELLASKTYGAVLLDMMLPDSRDEAGVMAVRAVAPATPVIIITGQGTVGTATRCMSVGARYVVEKPFGPEQILKQLRDCTVVPRHGGEAMVFRSEAMRKLIADANQHAQSTAPILILGETGSGKQMLARMIHEASPRRAAPCVRLDCAALPASLAERELFGHVRGAFSGAERAAPGLIASAAGGSLVLERVDEIPLDIQPKLLGFAQSGTIRAVGGTRELVVDARLISTGSIDLRSEMSAGRFRLDLFHRLAALELRVPPLREREGDIEHLARHFLQRADDEGPPCEIEREALDVLQAYSWPGNVRELRNAMWSARGAARGATVGTKHLPVLLRMPSQDLRIETKKDALYRDAIKSCAGDIPEAAKRLGVHTATVYRWIKAKGAR